MEIIRKLSPYTQRAATYWQQCTAWVLREEHKRQARELKEDARRAFTEHPEETGESYLEHLWFTAKMAGRLLFTAVVLLIHGIFPFLLVRTASSTVERVYEIMKSRIPKAKRDVIDAHYDSL